MILNKKYKLKNPYKYKIIPENLFEKTFLIACKI